MHTGRGAAHKATRQERQQHNKREQDTQRNPENSTNKHTKRNHPENATDKHTERNPQNATDKYTETEYSGRRGIADQEARAAKARRAPETREREGKGARKV